jgi:PST family polysaccharide transporter
MIVLRRLLKNTVVRNALLLYGVQFASYIPPLITLPYLSRILGPANFGLLSYAQGFSWYFITLTEYGFNLTATRRIAVQSDDPEGVSRTFSAVMVAKALLTVLGLILMLISVSFIPKLRPNLNLFLIVFLTVIGNMLFPLWLFQGLQQMQHIALRDVVAKLLAVAALFIFVHKQGDYLIAAAVQSGGLFLAGLIGLLTVPFVTRVRFHWPGGADVWDAMRTGWPVFLSMAASTMVLTTDVFILGLMSSSTEVGYFSAAYRLIAAVTSLVGPLVSSIYPHVSHKAASSEEEAVRFVRKYALRLSLPFVPIGLILLAGAPFIVRILFGGKYGPAIQVLQILSFSPFLLALSHCYSTYYMLACGYEKQWTRLMFLGVLVNFLLLIPSLFLFRGSLAISITAVGGNLFAIGVYYAFFRRHGLAPLAAQESAA